MADPADIRAQPVTSLMRRHWISVAPGSSLREAERLMRLARVRHLPVAEGGRLLGILSYQRVLQAWLARTLRQLGEAASPLLEPVAQLMEAVPVAVDPSESLAGAAAAMARSGLGCIPVVEGEAGYERLVGLLTERDLLRLAYDPAA